MKKLILILPVIFSGFFLGQNIVLTDFASGFSSPVEITNAGDSRLFVVQQNGMIKIVTNTGTVLPGNFLDISAKVTFNGERGLLGLAFHPQYATNGYFFVYYNNLSGNVTLARYKVSTTDPNIADAASEKILLTITKPFENHNGGSLHFAPDGMLWISTGDGGSGGDPNNNAQTITSHLGKMLRIDVNSDGTYNIPPDNPFAAINGAKEVWSFGLRNAWKFSFDLTTNQVLIADVGQSAIEEINRMPISQGGLNYGWRCFEGNNVYNSAGCPAQSTMTFPVAFYTHSAGKCSITGGYVYRGTEYPALAGKYFFADYCSKQIGLMSPDNSIIWTAAFAGQSFSTFGQDQNKELYVAALNTGKIFRVTTTTLATENNAANPIYISPNPARGTVFIKNLKTRNNTLEIITAEGRLAAEVSIDENGKADIRGMEPGVYFVTVKSAPLKIFSQKLIIK